MNSFALGKLVFTIGVNSLMTESLLFADFVKKSFYRYIDCDWGDMDDEDKAFNDEAVKSGDGPINGVYIDDDTGYKIWIITDADRSVTTVLFPYEY